MWQNNPAYYKKHLGSHIDYEQGKVRMWIGQEEEGEWLEQGNDGSLTMTYYPLYRSADTLDEIAKMGEPLDEISQKV